MHRSALWHQSPTRSVLRQENQSGPAGAVQIRARFSLVSTGTERLVATGRVPVSLYDSMQVPYMEGNFDLPIKYGYSLVGEVLEGPKPWLYRNVHLMHPHQSDCLVHQEDCTLLPSSLPPKRAVLASNLETALNAVWDARLSAGDRVLVVGFGLIGALTALLAVQYPATQVWIAEPDPDRKRKAGELGFRLLGDSPGALPVDVAFHTSHSSGGLQKAIDAAGPEGRIVELSWYGIETVQVKLGGDFHTLRKQIISSQVSQIPGHQRMRWDFARRKKTVLDLLEQDRWDDLLDVTVPFEKSPDLFDRIRKGTATGLGIVLKYD